MVFAEALGIPEKSAEKMIAKVVKLKDKYIAMCRASYLPEDMKETMEKLMEERIALLSGSH